DHVQVKAGPLDVLAKPTLVIGLIYSALQPLGWPEVFAPNVDIGLMAADGIGCDDHAFKEGVRVPLQDVAVLKGPGLTLVRIDNEVLWFGRFLRNEGPLLTGGEPRPAQTAQLGFGNFVDDLCRGHGGESFSGLEISTISDVVFEPCSVWIAEARGK